MMDARRSHEMPRLQIGWIDNVIVPLYTVIFFHFSFHSIQSSNLVFLKYFLRTQNVSQLCTKFDDHLKRAKQNRKNWADVYENNSKMKLTTVRHQKDRLTYI
jgi:hypothetical protein